LKIQTSAERASKTSTQESNLCFVRLVIGAGLIEESLEFRQVNEDRVLALLDAVQLVLRILNLVRIVIESCQLRKEYSDIVLLGAFGMLKLGSNKSLDLAVEATV